MSVYGYEYAGISTEDAVPEWNIKRVQWVPMGANDKKYLCDNYDDMDRCTQWLVYEYDTTDDPEVNNMVIIPCASDGSSPCDTPMLEHDGGWWDDTIADLQNDRLYIHEEE